MMTQQQWDNMTPAERDRARDLSDLHPALAPYRGYRVEGEYYGETRRFIVGQTTGWKPATLGLRSTRPHCRVSVLTPSNFTLLRVIGRVSA